MSCRSACCLVRYAIVGLGLLAPAVAQDPGSEPLQNLCATAKALLESPADPHDVAWGAHIVAERLLADLAPVLRDALAHAKVPGWTRHRTNCVTRS